MIVEQASPSAPTLTEVVQRSLLELADSLRGALLYLDEGAGEVAQTTLGLPLLLGERGSLLFLDEGAGEVVQAW